MGRHRWICKDNNDVTASFCFNQKKESEIMKNPYLFFEKAEGKVCLDAEVYLKG
jgi:hypothetical protein